MQAAKKATEQLEEEMRGLRRKIAELEEDNIKNRRVIEAWRDLWAQYEAMVEAFDGLIYICSENYEVEFMNQRFIERTRPLSLRAKMLPGPARPRRRLPLVRQRPGLPGREGHLGSIKPQRPPLVSGGEHPHPSRRRLQVQDGLDSGHHRTQAGESKHGAGKPKSIPPENSHSSSRSSADCRIRPEPYSRLQLAAA